MFDPRMTCTLSLLSRSLPMKPGSTICLGSFLFYSYSSLKNKKLIRGKQKGKISKIKALYPILIISQDIMYTLCTSILGRKGEKSEENFMK